jgi:hypothetical protein
MVHFLVTSDAPSKHPSSVLELLFRSIDVQASWPSRELRTLLDQLLQNDRALKQDGRYQALHIYLEQKEL